jgi:hypothetical protein
MHPQQPSFQQRSYPMDTWHHDVGWFWTGRKDGFLVDIAPIGEIILPFPAVGVQNRAWLNGSPHELLEAFRADIGDASESHSHEPHQHVDLHGDDYDGFLFGMPAVCTFLQTANIRLIHLHKTAQSFATGPNQRPSHLVEPCPCRLIAAKPLDPLKPQRTATKLLVAYVPHRTELQTKGSRGPLKNWGQRQFRYPLPEVMLPQPLTAPIR